jgi:restriction system protein
MVRSTLFREAREALAGLFQLTAEERAALLPSGRQHTFDNRVAWAKIYLERADLLASPRRGYFQISERGREVLSKPFLGPSAPELFSYEGLSA